MFNHRVAVINFAAAACLAAAAVPADAGALLVVDDFESGLVSGLDSNSSPIGFNTFQGSGSSAAIATSPTPPAPVLPAVGTPNNVLQVDIDATSFAGLVHFFENAAANAWVSQNWSDYEGFSFWIYGSNSGTSLFIDLLENRSPGSTTDDAERWTTVFTDNFSGWQLFEFPFANFTRKDIGNGAPDDGLTLIEVHGWAFGTLNTGGPWTYYLDQVSLYGTGVPVALSVSFATGTTFVDEGTTGNVVVSLNRPMVSEDPAQVSVDYFTEVPASTATAGRDYTPLAGTLTFVNGGSSELGFPIEILDDTKFEGNERIALRLTNPVDVDLGETSQASGIILDSVPFDPNLVDDFERGAFLWYADGGLVLETPEIAAGDMEARPGQDPFERILVVSPPSPVRGPGVINSFGRDFAIGQDWSGAAALRFWFYGNGSGSDVGVTLKDNRAPDPGPSGWNLVWSDEFNSAAGTPPDASNWSLDIGDINPLTGATGWGNEELQYFTDDLANAATDGIGNLKLAVQEADGSLLCYYGPCEYTSAQLISKNKAEFAYGRIEARVQVPQGEGIWASFRSISTQLAQLGFPLAGQIDNLEFVGRLSNEIFGRIQGPGYAGGGGYGGVYDFGTPVFNDFHTIAVEWQPDLIVWYIDGILFHSATPADIAPNEWVFNAPRFLQFNVAVGGNFGGPVGFLPPRSLLVDYVRVYQAADTAERFETSFVDDVPGWREVIIPFTAFTRGVAQPIGAPDDGLGLNDVWGYGFTLSNNVRGQQGLVRLDLVRLDTVLDSDGDGVPDDGDNCILVVNPMQRDTDGDGFGNFCDGDFDNNGVVNLTDLSLMRLGFFGNDPDLDMNGDGVVNFLDLQLWKDGFLLPPGPAAPTNSAIDIEKATNGVDADDPNAGDAPQIAPGNLVTWTYVVTNTGNTTLNDVVVTDDQGVAVSCPQNTLSPGESMVCTATGLADDLNNTGFTTVPGLCGGNPNTPLYENMGQATGQSASGQFVQDVDPSHYCNPVMPAIDIEKATNGVDADDPNAGDAPQIVPGNLVTWTYVVTNTGNTTLNDVVVIDDQGVPVACPQDTLSPGESLICTASGVADDLNNTGFTTVPGLCGGSPSTPLYENMGQATGQSASGQFVQDVDPSHYCNPVMPAIDIEKATNGVDADDPNAGDAPQIVPGNLVTWTYVVTNTGNTTLNDVVVIDDQGVPVACPQDTLSPGESLICTASGVADDLNNTGFTTVPGLCGGSPSTPLYENMGQATGQSASGQFVQDVDPSHYCNPVTQ